MVRIWNWAFHQPSSKASLVLCFFDRPQGAFQTGLKGNLYFHQRLRRSLDKGKVMQILKFLLPFTILHLPSYLFLLAICFLSISSINDWLPVNSRKRTFIQNKKDEICVMRAEVNDLLWMRSIAFLNIQKSILVEDI